ncbi:MAG: UDP-3-O-acyl-N-acetylglucosamine deacetylase [Rhodospirillales bacterium]|nr:UDP-3-O-acyl-N-acetylglucosamine deacetylase [Rhodospirillales bacterium]
MAPDTNTVTLGVDSFERYDVRGFVAQKTLRSPIHCSGIALHSGVRVSMRLLPAAPNAGINFVRTDIPGGAVVPAIWDNVVDTRLCTVIANDQAVTVGTVEHLMAALAGLGIDNATIEIDGPEVPIMDGSSGPFVFLVECAGIVEQASPRRAIRILSPVGVGGDGWSATLSPGKGFSVSMEIDFESRAIARQSIDLGLHRGMFKRELARARTFGFLRDVERLRDAGLARGGSLDNVVVVSDDAVLNDEGLRYDDEFVRHKALDAIGDMYLAGAPIIGHFEGICTGHAANSALLKALFKSEGSWAWDMVRTGDDVVSRPVSSWQSSRLARAVGL